MANGTMYSHAAVEAIRAEHAAELDRLRAEHRTALSEVRSQAAREREETRAAIERLEAECEADTPDPRLSDLAQRLGYKTADAMLASTGDPPAIAALRAENERIVEEYTSPKRDRRTEDRKR